MLDKLKIMFLLLISGIASLATAPYGYEFVKFLLPASSLQFGLGIFFATVASLANWTLGFYSLLKTKFNFLIFPLFIAMLNAFIVGTLSYFGYQHMLPVSLNLLMSLVTFMVNLSISYIAIVSLMGSAKNIRSQLKKMKLPEKTIRGAGLALGAIVSVIGFFIALKGIKTIFTHYHCDSLLHYRLEYVIAFMMWLSYCALFSNSNQRVAGKLYKREVTIHSGILNVGIIFLCLVSGGSLAEIARQFIAPLHIMNLEKIFMVLAFFSNAALSYFAIQEVVSHFRPHS